MKKRDAFYQNMLVLEKIIDHNKKNGRDTGPIISGLYDRLCQVFNHNRRNKK